MSIKKLFAALLASAALLGVVVFNIYLVPAEAGAKVVASGGNGVNGTRSKSGSADVESGASDSEITEVTALPDFSLAEDVATRKQQFFDFFQPFVDAENEKIAVRRGLVLSFNAIAQDGGILTESEHNQLMDMAILYRLDVENTDWRGLITELVLRVDTIPASLVLAQAANESAWGTSRFAVDGNNLFGQWCYREGCGLVPQQRAEGATHEVRKFESVEESISAYFRNLNSHSSYEHLRNLRKEMRSAGIPLDAVVLANGLSRYSERGHHYVDEIQTMINQNQPLIKDSNVGRI